jgi:hypothetical protein
VRRGVKFVDNGPENSSSPSVELSKRCTESCLRGEQPKRTASKKLQLRPVERKDVRRDTSLVSNIRNVHYESVSDALDYLACFNLPRGTTYNETGVIHFVTNIHCASLSPISPPHPPVVSDGRIL